MSFFDTIRNIMNCNCNCNCDSSENPQKEYRIPKFRITQEDDDNFKLEMQYFTDGIWHHVNRLPSLESARRNREELIKYHTKIIEDSERKKAKGYPKEVE